MIKRISVIIVLLVLVVSITFLSKHLGFNRSDSVDFKIYWHMPFQEAVERDHYYVVRYSSSEFDGYLTKKAVCLPGEQLSRQSSTFFCDGSEVARVLITHDMDGNAYPQYDIEEPFTLSDSIFFIGDSLNSYDSRYIGPLPLSAVYREVYPLW